MHRSAMLVLALALLKTAGRSDIHVPPAQVIQSPQLSKAAGAPFVPVLEVSLYAPQQKEPPVHIVGFWNDESDVQFVLSNESNKAVTLVKVDFVEVAPSGCSTQPTAGGPDGYSAGGFPVRLAPHSKTVTTGVGAPGSGASMPQTVREHYPHSIFAVAQSSGAAYIQAQIGITAVWFGDGTTWPADWSSAGHPPSQQYPFDPSLVEAEAGKCTNVASVASALKAVKEVVFDRQSPQRSDPDDKSAPPHLRFGCTLEGENAICRLPTDRK